MTLLMAALFFGLAAVVLRAGSSSLRRALDDETDLRDLLADESPWMPEPVASSQASLQAVNECVCVCASRGVHTFDSDERPAGSLRGTVAKEARTL